MKRVMCFSVVLCLAGVLLFALTANAATEQYAATPNGGEWEYNPYGNAGSEFTVTTNLTVTQLGFYDWGQDGLADAHEVGLWDAAGNLLASTVIQSGTGSSLAADGYRWNVVSAVPLIAGDDYIVGAYFPSASDHFSDAAPINADFTMIKDLYLDGAGFAEPTTSDFNSNTQGWFGPNVGTESVPPVPEPITMFSAFMAISGLGMYVRRRVGVVKA